MIEDLSPHEQRLFKHMRPLVKKRIRLSFILSGALLAVYGAYIFLLSSFSELGNVKVFGAATLVIVASLFIVISGVVTAGVYTWWCKRHLDPAMKLIRESSSNE